MQKKTKKIIISTILFLLTISIIILLTKSTNKPMPQNITEQAKANYTTEIGTQTYDITNAVLEPEGITPTISAGMIPVKWNGENFEIITRQDKTWYDYTKGQPAYIMLNDGYYKSELEVGIKEDQLMENNEGTNITHPEDLGTICMWIPRFAYNEQGKILYIKQAHSVAGIYTMPEIFTYQTEKRDLSLAGIWLECKPLANTSEVNTKINKMNGKNNTYGFLANTIATNANNEPTYKTTIETYNQYIANVVGATSVRNTQENLPNVALTTEEYPSNIGNNASTLPQITDILNPNRTILKITNSNQLEPIKGKAYYDETGEKIKIEITYRTNAIVKILDKTGKELSTNSTTADTGEEIIGNKTYKFIVIDNIGNIKEIETTVTGLDIYIIENEDDLKLFRDAVNEGKTTTKTKAYQIADVKMNEGKYTIDEETGDITFASNAEQWTPIGISNTIKFQGTYDGQRHTISGIYINTTNDYQGLFGYIHNCTIQNLNVTKSYIKGRQNIGGIIGVASNNNNIINCCNEASVNGIDSGAGGIVGNIGSGSIINRCYNKAIVNGASWIGGICGCAGSCTINNCYNTGTVTSSIGRCGGIVGENRGVNISNCYNIGSIYATRSDAGRAGGIAGEEIYIASNINNCYNEGIINGAGGLGGIAGTIEKSNITNCVNATEKITGTYLTIGGICGYIREKNGKVSASSYLKTNSSLYGIGAWENSSNNTQYNSDTGCTIYTSIESMPTILSVINSENAFVEDTNNINNGYPILAWQLETEG